MCMVVCSRAVVGGIGAFLCFTIPSSFVDGTQRAQRLGSGTPRREGRLRIGWYIRTWEVNEE